MCGGGRYDGLAEVLGGTATPGVGFGMGLERLLLVMEADGAPMASERAPRVFVVAIGVPARAAAAGLVRDLRAAGVPASAALEDRPVKNQFRMADRAGAEWAAVIGERELAEGSVTLRRLADGEERSVPMVGVVAAVGEAER